MSALDRETMVELMAYADGELEGAARARVEGLIAASPEARGVVEAMGALGERVRTLEANGAGAPSPSGIVDAVMARLDADARRSEERGADTGPMSRTTLRATDEPTSILPRSNVVRLAGRRRRVAMVTAGAAALSMAAIAAAYVLVVRPAVEQAALTPVIPSALATPPAGGDDDEQDLPGVAVARVEADDHPFSVILLPAVKAATNANASSVVLWITDDPSPGDH